MRYSKHLPFLTTSALVCGIGLSTAVLAQGQSSKLPDIPPQLAVGKYTTKQELVGVRETSRFSIDSEITVFKSGQKRSIRIDTDEIWVKNIARKFTARLENLEAEVPVRSWWKSMFRSNSSGKNTAAIELRCNVANCFTRSEAISEVCVSGCASDNHANVAPSVSTEFAQSVHIPMESRQTAEEAAGQLIKLILERNPD